jgi:TrmH family RNA methyltransferase
MFVEGVRLVGDLLDSGLALECVLFTPELQASERGKALLQMAADRRFRGAVIPAALMRSICDVESPQGIVAVAAMPSFELDDVFGDGVPLVVALDSLQDPGNLGTIVRAAEAAGASGVVASSGCVEPYSAKAVRASMGSAFRLPIARRTSPAAFAEACAARDIRVVALATRGEQSCYDFDWTVPSALLVGNEGAGLSDDWRSLASASVRIPMASPVESLNAGIAAAVVLFLAAGANRA